MRPANLDLNLLRALQVLLAERSVTRTAELLHLSQPAVSGILARLRAAFDDPLLVPVGRMLELSPLARELAGPLNDVLVRTDALLAHRQAFDPASGRRHFNIVASEYATEVLLAPVLQQVQIRAPGVSVALRQPAGRAAEELDDPDTDLVLTLESYASPDHARQRLFADQDVVVVDRDHPDVGESVTMEQFLALGQVRYVGARYGLTMFDGWYEQHAPGPRRIEATVDSFHLVAALLIGTRRAATLPARLAERYGRQMSLRIVQPLFAIPHLVEVLQWHPGRGQDPASRWLREQILALAARLPQSPAQPPSAG